MPKMRAQVLFFILLLGIGVLAFLWISSRAARFDPELNGDPPAGDPADPRGTPPQLSAIGSEKPRDEPAPKSVGLVRVLRADGRPVEGAQLHAARPGAAYVARKLVWAAETDAQGHVTVPLEQIPAGHEIVVRAAGLLPTAIAPPPTGDEVDVVLADGHTVTGEVVDVWGRPAQASVHLFARMRAAPRELEGYLPGLSAARNEQSVVTDASGRFRLSGIAAFPVQLTARAPGMVCPWTAASELRAPGASVRLVLHPQARVGIQAFDAQTRQPLRGYEVTTTDTTYARGVRLSSYERSGNQAPPRGFLRDGSAYWHVFSLTPDAKEGSDLTVPLVVRSWGYRHAEVDVSIRLPGDPHYDTPQRVYLEPLTSRDVAGQARFRVSFPAAGRPPDRVWIDLDSDSLDMEPGLRGARKEDLRGGGRQCLWLQDGEASVQLPAGEYRVAVSGPCVNSVKPRAEPFQVVEGTTTTVALEIPTSIVHVRVKDSGGQALPFFHASCSWGAGGNYFSHATLLGSDLLDDVRRIFGATPGELHVPMPPGVEGAVVVFADGFEPWAHRMTARAGQRHDLEVTLQRK